MGTFTISHYPISFINDNFYINILQYMASIHLIWSQKNNSLIWAIDGQALTKRVSTSGMLQCRSVGFLHDITLTTWGGFVNWKICQNSLSFTSNLYLKVTVYLDVQWNSKTVLRMFCLLISRGISQKSNMWHFQFSVLLMRSSLREVHFAEHPNWIGPVVPKL